MSGEGLTIFRARRGKLRLRCAFALPLLVLAIWLQADAVVKSTVMNLLAFSDRSSAPCPMGMPGMTMASMGIAHGTGPQKPQGRETPAQHAPCAYCAAAHHTPILTVASPVQPSCAATFASYRTTAVHGPRGPPSVQPRARGPPLTA